MNPLKKQVKKIIKKPVVKKPNPDNDDVVCTQCGSVETMATGRGWKCLYCGAIFDPYNGAISI